MLEYEQSFNFAQEQPPARLLRVSSILPASRAVVAEGNYAIHQYQEYTKNQLIWLIEQYQREVIPAVNKQLGSDKGLIEAMQRGMKDMAREHTLKYDDLHERFVRTSDAACALLSSCTGDGWEVEAVAGENSDGKVMELRGEDQ